MEARTPFPDQFVFFEDMIDRFVRWKRPAQKVPMAAGFHYVEIPIDDSPRVGAEGARCGPVQEAYLQ